MHLWQHLRTAQYVDQDTIEPLIIGSVDTGYFISSDILGFIEYTDKAIFLENRDIVVLDSKTFKYMIRMEIP